MRKSILVGTAAIALLAGQAAAQTPPGPFPAQAVAQRVEPGRYWVFFDLDRSNLRRDALEVIAESAASFKRTGATRISLVGAADLSGSAAHNQRLSERRADAVKAELTRLGVPASAVTIRAEGDTSPIVPTARGVREPLNRYVAIDFPERQAPPPVAAAPPPAPPPPAPPPKWEASLGPWAGYNLKEKDGGDNQKSSVLVGPELRLGYSFTPEWSTHLDLTGYNTVGTSSDDGYGGRVALGLRHQWNLGAWHPFIGPKVGYISGKGVQDSLVIGPEVGVNLDISPMSFAYARVAYDNVFRNEPNQGIINGGLGVGFRF